MNKIIQENQMKLLIEYHREHKESTLIQSGKGTYELGEDYTDLLSRIAILRRTSKTQLIRDLLNQEADAIGGAEVLYPEV